MNRSPQSDFPSEKPRKLICVGDPLSLPSNVDADEVIVIQTAGAVLDELEEPLSLIHI